MRHRLIPSEERHQMHREYYMRVAIVSVSVLAVAVAAGAAALFPADIRARVSDRAAIQAIASAKNKSTLSNLDQAEQELRQATALLEALGSDSTQTRFSDVVRAIILVHSPVLISSFAIDREGTTTVNVTLQGIAPTRDDLLAFKSRLEALTPGATVDLPISTLAKNISVPFSLRLTEHLQ